MLPQGLIRFRRPLIILLHLILVPIGYYTAFALRFDFNIPARYMSIYWLTLPVVIIARFTSLGMFKLFRGWWRYSGITEITATIKATSLSSVVLVAWLVMTESLPGYPRSVILLDWAVAILLFSAARLSARILREEPLLRLDRRHRKIALIVGAGDTGEALIRSFRRSREERIVPLAIVDDDPDRHGMYIHGVPVVGSVRDLPRRIDKYGATMVMVADPHLPRETLKLITDACLSRDVACKIVSTTSELPEDVSVLTRLRNVEVEDLLGRPAIDLDPQSVQPHIAGQVVLVTGAAGSIGSELAQQLARLGPGRLILVERAESPLYFAHLDLVREHPTLDVVPIIADVVNEQRMADIFRKYRPDFVFHAAAYKHVPMMESNVSEAVRNNVFGTLNVALRAAEHNARRFVHISTDKAVRPSSVMGATKRITERLVLGWPSLRSSSTDFRAVRFGNVLGSDGSVLPLFKRQIHQGGPITLTHPDVTRFFMTIPEAATLVLQAATLSEAAGRISMLEMGQPVRIADLAENLVRLSGLAPQRDIQVEFIGLRPGEKLYEELMSEVESTVPTSNDQIRIVQSDESDASALESQMLQLGYAVRFGNNNDLLEAIRELVPECVAPLRSRVTRTPWANAPPVNTSVSSSSTHNPNLG